MMKKRKILSILLVVLFIFSSCITAFAVTTIQVDNYQLERIDSTHYSIYKYLGNEKDLSIMNSYSSSYITQIGSTAFFDNQNISKVTFNKDMKIVKSNAFCGSSVVEVVCNKNLTTIESCAFEDCKNLVKITIDKSTTSIAKDAFDSSPNVVIYCYKDSAAETYAKTNKISYVLIDDPTEPTTEPTTESTTEPTTEPTTPTEPVKTTYILGDGNDNGHIDISDATVVQLLMAKLIDDDGRLSQRIDINGACDITNATLLQMYLAKLSTIYDDAIGTTREYTK